MIKEVNGKVPHIHESCFVAENATVVGDVIVGENTSIWYGVCIRSDMDRMIIGKNNNIQENSTLHNDFGIPTVIGDGVTVGHNCVIHGCKISNNVLVGMGTVILNGAEIGENTIIGAGSLITQNKKIPSGVLCMGSPARIVRRLTQEEIMSISESWKHYIEISEIHR